jgi:putative flippase GtrA
MKFIKYFRTNFFDKFLLKFLAVGLVNTVVAASLMFGLYNLAKFGYWMSSAVTYIIASVVSFFLNKSWTFEAKGFSFYMVAVFALTIAVSYLIAYSIAKPLIYRLLQNYSEKIRGNISLFTGMCFFTALNYTGQRFVVFGKKNG